MRSTSMPLFGFEETRINFSSGLTVAVGCGAGAALRWLRPLIFLLAKGADSMRSARPFRAERTDGTGKTHLQTIGSGNREAGDASPQEVAEAAMELHARFAVGAEFQMTIEILLLTLTEGTVKEEVGNTFDVATQHSMPSWQSR